jgi:PAS domain S-box-containing protein
MFVCILGTSAILWDLARQQDAAWVQNSRALVTSVNNGRKAALARSALDFASRNDAYRNITQRWKRKWVERNFTSLNADGILLFRNGQVRHIWAPHDAALTPADLRAMAIRLSGDTDVLQAAAAGGAAEDRVRSDFAMIGDRLVLLAVAPVGWEPAEEARLGPATSRDFVALVDIVEQDKLARFGRSVGLHNLHFRPASEPTGDEDAYTAIPVHDDAGAVLGGIAWVRMRPGSENFAKDIWPIGVGLLLCAVLALLATRRLTLQQLEATARADRALAHLKAYQVALDEHAVVVMIDPKGIVSYANDRYLTLTGMAREELVGQPQAVMRFDYHAAEYYDDIARATAAGQGWRGEVRNVDREGNVYWLDSAVIRQESESEDGFSIVFVAYEITGRKLAEEAAARRAAVDSLIADMQAELLSTGSFHQALARALETIAQT